MLFSRVKGPSAGGERLGLGIVERGGCRGPPRTWLLACCAAAAVAESDCLSDRPDLLRPRRRRDDLLLFCLLLLRALPLRLLRPLVCAAALLLDFPAKALAPASASPSSSFDADDPDPDPPNQSPNQDFDPLLVWVDAERLLFALTEPLTELDP